MTELQCNGCQYLVEQRWCRWHNCEACTVPDCPAVKDGDEEE
jgi:hypothetical protein